MDPLPQRTQQVIESLTENEALTDQLDDTAAQLLLDWGIALSKPIVQSTAALDETAAADAMQPQLQATRRLLRAVNRHFTPAATEQTSRAAPASNEATLAMLHAVVEQASIILGARFNKPDEQQLARFADQLANEARTPQALILALQKFVDQHQVTPPPSPPPEAAAAQSHTSAAQPLKAQPPWMQRLFEQLRRFYQPPKEMD